MFATSFDVTNRNPRYILVNEVMHMRVLWVKNVTFFKERKSCFGSK